LAGAIVEAGATEWQWLRLKPAGRGVDAYADLALDEAQRAALWPLALELERATGLVIRWDCAMTPFLAQHGSVSPDDAARLGVVGCVGGTRLMARDARGGWSPCSFAGVDADEAAGGDLPPAVAYASDERVLAWRGRAVAPPAPCDTCAWRDVCRGGCRVVARHLTGDELAPDPECARVRAWQA
jgi:radical SAM protein with 4Fe4S-binding SPASM domain